MDKLTQNGKQLCELAVTPYANAVQHPKIGVLEIFRKEKKKLDLGH